MLSNGFSSIKMRSVGEQKKLHISKFSETKKYSQKVFGFHYDSRVFFRLALPLTYCKTSEQNGATKGSSTYVWIFPS